LFLLILVQVHDVLLLVVVVVVVVVAAAAAGAKCQWLRHGSVVIACWVCGFESNLGAWMSLVNVVCGQEEVPLMGCSLIWRSAIEHGVSESVVMVVCFSYMFKDV